MLNESQGMTSVVFFKITQLNITSKQTSSSKCASGTREYTNIYEKRKLDRNEFMKIYMRACKKSRSEHGKQDTDYKEKARKTIQ